MTESTEILAEVLEAALCELEEGIVVLDSDARVLFWNPAAYAITGYLGAAMLARNLPAGFYERAAHHATAEAGRSGEPEPIDSGTGRPMVVHLHHRQGHTLPAMLRRTLLRNSLGKRFGTLLRFHPVEEIDALPHGATDVEDDHEHRVEQSQADLEDRLDEAWHEWTTNTVPFGLLWVAVDQAAALRKTHGRDAAEAMLTIVERTLLHGLRPAEILGRWGTNEFLALCHERTAEMLEAHARHVCGLARTADFRWWGDRVGLTVSIGAAQAAEGEGLRCLLERTRQGMQESAYAGGNHVALKAISISGGAECSQS